MIPAKVRAERPVLGKGLDTSFHLLRTSITMASNKNQHFVPRCYLRPFTLNGENQAINLFNIDRLRFIAGAPVKSQCSSDYFYGEDLRLEKVLQVSEGAYAAALREILSPAYKVTDPHRDLLRHFCLLQHLRTEAASRRAVEMSEGMVEVIGDGVDFRMSIRDAVLMSMRAFVENMDILEDLKICLLRNRTDMPFITSDDPAVLTNRWYLESKKTRGASFGLHSAGTLFFLPLSPKILCLGYDSDVYSLPHDDGWVDIRNTHDVNAINQQQYLNCRANIFIQDPVHAERIAQSFREVAHLRPTTTHKINYAVLDRSGHGHKRFRVVDRATVGEHEEALIHTQAVHAQPSAWPRQVKLRPNGCVYTNGTGLGFVRKNNALRDHSFRKESL